MISKVVHSSVTHTWMTPDSFLELVRQMGPIALDPCTSADNPTGAGLYFAPSEGDTPRYCTQGWCGPDGLAKSWVEHARGGLVYVNCPYGRSLGAWVAKCVEEARQGAEIILLVPARTGAKWFQSLWGAEELLMWRGRIKFKGATAGAPFDSCVAYWGPRPRRFRDAFGNHGQLVRSAA